MHVRWKRRKAPQGFIASIEAFVYFLYFFVKKSQPRKSKNPTWQGVLPFLVFPFHMRKSSECFCPISSYYLCEREEVVGLFIVNIFKNLLSNQTNKEKTILRNISPFSGHFSFQKGKKRRKKWKKKTNMWKAAHCLFSVFTFTNQAPPYQQLMIFLTFHPLHGYLHTIKCCHSQ